MSETEIQYYDKLMALYSENKGRITLEGRRKLVRIQANLGMSADKALLIEHTVKKDFEEQRGNIGSDICDDNDVALALDEELLQKEIVSINAEEGLL